MVEHDVKDMKLSRNGRTRIEWAAKFMPVLESIKERFSREKPLRGIRIGCCLHVTSETANLVISLKSGGANVWLCASNPLSTQDDVAASLVHDQGIPVFAVKDEGRQQYYQHIYAVLAHKPEITTDDGADLVSTLHSKKRHLLPQVIGGTEETTTGVIRLKSMEKNKVLAYPIIAVNDSYTKFMFDNRYGTGQSALDGILRATNWLFAGSTVVVCGYGWCGRGVAAKAKGLGAEVIVTEVNPIRALEARMDGYRVMRLMDACRYGNVFITVTGDMNVIDRRHMLAMKNGAVICNAGHFDAEINKKALNDITKSKRELRRFCVEHTLNNGKSVILLAEGRLVNLSAAEGHPAMVMDMSFANQALAVEYILLNRDKLGKRVYKLPDELDRKIAELKLRTMGIKIDRLTREQAVYISSWRLGT
ncbi:adenosylhomocysteinase [candidate division WOR-3 bacterium JGI_Cruoil_03_51_56]|uniref:Adenosylhomocysteinase n=1 Tax=candidate division WOR-3 bacterium JGI_Cruoil_03_51_56 TaxID=1973747 RepID=A0A235BTU2_UNCW3|nr:MAG: adenosylhomocysteinase [candidate division WOR-3 bacterium JGI_Cruoil_03_51_56]